jgi:hypothetical protein
MSICLLKILRAALRSHCNKEKTRFYIFKKNIQINQKINIALSKRYLFLKFFEGNRE